MTEKELELEFEMYLAIFEDEYDQEETDFIKENIKDFLAGRTIVDITAQVLVALDRLPDEENKYKKYFEFLKSRYSLNDNILEVGCGKFPALAKFIDDHQKEIKEGTITAYDPSLITTKYGNIKLHRKKFDTNLDLSQYSLITAMNSCDVTTKIIEAANEQDKDFSILTCGCTHFPNQIEDSLHYPERLKAWRKHLIDTAKSTLSQSRTLDIDYIEDMHNPIISSRKKVKIIK